MPAGFCLTSVWSLAKGPCKTRKDSEHVGYAGDVALRCLGCWEAPPYERMQPTKRERFGVTGWYVAREDPCLGEGM